MHDNTQTVGSLVIGHRLKRLFAILLAPALGCDPKRPGAGSSSDDQYKFMNDGRDVAVFVLGRRSAIFDHALDDAPLRVARAKLAVELEVDILTLDLARSDAFVAVELILAAPSRPQSIHVTDLRMWVDTDAAIALGFVLNRLLHQEVIADSTVPGGTPDVEGQVGLLVIGCRVVGDRAAFA